MEKIFYADKSAYPNSEVGVKKILAEYYGLHEPVILRGEHGKPYLKDGPHFSVTHTKERLYIAFSSKPLGLDAESLSRNPFYQTVILNFPPEEQAEIISPEAFLKHWVVKESAVKYLGSSLAHDLKNFAYIGGKLLYKGEPFPADIQLLTHEGYILSVCGGDKIYEFVPL